MRLTTWHLLAPVAGPLVRLLGWLLTWLPAPFAWLFSQRSLRDEVGTRAFLIHSSSSRPRSWSSCNHSSAINVKWPHGWAEISVTVIGCGWEPKWKWHENQQSMRYIHFKNDKRRSAFYHFQNVIMHTLLVFMSFSSLFSKIHQLVISFLM